MTRPHLRLAPPPEPEKLPPLPVWAAYWYAYWWVSLSIAAHTFEMIWGQRK